MAFRETIEAWLKVKDANKFKEAMRTSKKAVEGLAHAEERAAATSELLERIEKKLERNSIELAAAMEGLSHSVDQLGDNMLQTAGKAAIMNTAVKKSGSNAFFLGKSFAFWKDRLSLTRSEILSTTYTIGAYFIPAIISMGSSLANAAIGGGAVAGAGLASLTFGLGAFALVLKPVANNLKKVTKAQDEYTLAVAQYGAASTQASRASAHMYGVIKTQGGPAVLRVVTAYRKLREEWNKSTKPAQKSVLGILGDAMGTAHVLLPQVSQETNQMMGSLRTALGKGMTTLFSGPSGGEFRDTLRVLGNTFSKSIGPGIHGVSNMILVLGRIIRAAAPWVVKLSKAWADFTDRLVARSSDQQAVKKFIDNAVHSFKLWWGLLKEIGRTLRIVFGATKGEGDKVVVVLTNGVRALNDWLQALSDKGKIRAFFDEWNRSVSVMWNTLKNALMHPETILPNILRAIDYLAPIIMNHLATAIVVTAPVAADHFAKAFLNAGAWAKFFVVGYFLKKFGFFAALGKKMAEVFVAPFIKAFSERFLAALGVESTLFAEGGALSKGLSTVGGRLGAVFGKAFVIGILAGAVMIAPTIGKELSKLPVIGPLIGRYSGGAQGSGKKAWENLFHDLTSPFKSIGKALMPSPSMFHQTGGTISAGSFGIVGEAGPEIARVTGAGTQITPLRGLNPITSMPNISGAFHVTVHSSIVVDRREIARAVSTERAYVTARRS